MGVCSLAVPCMLVNQCRLMLDWLSLTCTHCVQGLDIIRCELQQDDPGLHILVFFAIYQDASSIFRVGIVTNKTQCLFPLSKAQPLVCFLIHDRFDLFHESLAQTSLCSFPSVPGFHCCWLLQHLCDMNQSSAWWMGSTPKTGCCLCL